MSDTVKYWKKIEDGSRLEPYSITRAGVNRFMSDNENWCPSCFAVVEFDGKLDATGITNICPFCGSETKNKVTGKQPARDVLAHDTGLEQAAIDTFVGYNLGAVVSRNTQPLFDLLIKRGLLRLDKNNTIRRA